MPVDVQIRFRAESKTAQREIDQLKKEVQGLRQQLGSTQRVADTAGNEIQQLGQQSATAARGVDQLGDEAKQASVGIDSLGRNIFKTSAEAKKFGGVFQDTNGRLREANGRWTAMGVTVEKFTGGLGGASRGTGLLNHAFGAASRGAGLFTTGLGLLQSQLGALGVVAVGQQISRFAVQSVQASGQLEQLIRATTQIEGSAEAAEQRMADLREIADLPGLNFEPLTRFSNRLRAAGVSGADTNTILLTVGQTILSLGGSADKAALAMEQIIQAIQLGQVDFRDFRTIVQQIPGFLEALADVHGVEANIDGLHQAYERVGGSIIDILIPTFEELERRFESPPLDSYIVRIDALQNAFFHAQAAIGDLFLPTVTEGARVLTEFLEAIRVGTKDLTTLPEPIQEIIAGAQSLYNSLKLVGETIIGVVGPPIGELADAFGGLLGEVLELAGALLTALEPVLKLVSYVVGTVVLAVAQLAEHLGTLIGGLSDAVNWLAFWSDEGEKAKTSTDNLAASQNNLRTAAAGATQAVEGATAALNENATAGDQARARLRNLVAQLETVNATVERYEERLRKAQAANNTRDIDFYTRGLETQRERAASLTAEIGKLSDTYGDAGTKLGENATALEQQEARLKDLQAELRSANQEVERSNRLLEAAKEKYTSDASPAVQQYERRVTTAKVAVSEINTEIEKTESQIGKLQGATDAATDATDENTGAVTAAKVEYVEYTNVIRMAQREVQAFSNLNEELRGFDDFWRIAAGQAGEYRAAVDLATVTVVDHQAELDALVASNFFDGLEDPIAEYGASLEATSVAADGVFDALNRVDTSVRETGADFRVAEERLREFDAAFQLTEATIPRATSAMRAFTGTAPSVGTLTREVDLLNEAFQATEPTLTDVDSAIREITTEIDRRTVGTIRRAESSITGLSQTFADLALDTDSNTRAIVEDILEIPAAIETLGAGDAFAQLGTDFGIAFGVNFVANVISELTEGFEDSEYKRAIRRAYEPGRVLEDPDAAFNRAEGARTLIGGLTGTDLDTDALESLLGGIRDNQLVDGLSTVQERVTGLLTDFFGGDFEDPFTGLREIMDAAADTFESAEAAEIGPAFQEFVETANDFFDSQIEIIRIIGTETGQNLEGLVADINRERQGVLNAVRVNFGARTQPQQTALEFFDETTGSGVGAPQPTGEASRAEPASTETLGDVFRLTGEQRGILAPLEGAVQAAQDFIDDFITEDSTPEDIQSAYTNLVNAEQALYDQQVLFIQNATDVTEDARTRALTVAGQVFDREIREANNDLVDALEGIGLELTNALTFASGILRDSVLVSVQQIPKTVEDAGTDLQAPEQETQVLRNVHRFTSEESDILGGLQNAVDIAQAAVDALDANSTPQDIATAYTDLAAAETRLFDQAVQFIENATGVTDTAREQALELAGIRFGNEIFRANTDLVDALEATGLQLANTLEDWYSILTGSALDTQQIPPPEVPETPEAPLREVFRFTGAQQDILRTLRGGVTEAEDELNRLRRDDTATPEQITAAYTELSRASAAVLAQEAAFITAATDITDEARTNALTQANQRFRADIFDANVGLVGSLENLGFQLATTIENWQGVLSGALLAVQEIPDLVEPAAEEPINTSRLQNAMDRARFQLTGATTEQDFETRRQELIRAVNAYYDAEQERIEGLEASETQLQDLREDTDLARERALRQAMTATNRFAQERISNEARAAAAATQAAERAETERLRTEQRVQDQIESLRDDQLDNAQARADRLIEIEEDAQRRLEEIEEDAMRRREDSQLTFQRRSEDLQREHLKRFEELETQFERGEITQEEFGTRAEALADDIAQQRIAAGRADDRRREDIDIREDRAETDLDARTAGRQQEAIFEAEQNAVAIRDALTPLLAGGTSELESQTATMAAETATMAAETAAIASETAATNKTVAEMFEPAVGTFGTASDTLHQAAVELAEADIDQIATAISSLTGVISTLPEELDSVFGKNFQELSQLIAQAKPPIIGIGGGQYVETQALGDLANLTPADLVNVEPIELIGTPNIDGAAVSPEMLGVTAPAELPTSYVETLSITAKTVNVSGEINGLQTGSSDRQSTPQESTIVVENIFQLPDGSVQAIGETVVRQRQQGRSLL